MQDSPERRRRERGTTMVEMALAIIPVLAMLFTIVDFSFPIFLRSLLNHAVREGARYAITYRTIDGKSQTESIRDVVMTSASGFLKGDAGREKIKVRYFSPITFAEDTGPNRNSSGNIVEVSVEGFQWTYMVQLKRTGGTVNIGASSADRLETMPRGVALPLP